MAAKRCPTCDLPLTAEEANGESCPICAIADPQTAAKLRITPSATPLLIDCSACNRQISIEAESCPGCGHPNRTPIALPKKDTCYACSATATMRCQVCGALSCVNHVSSEWALDPGTYELQCESCRPRRVFGFFMAQAIIFAIGLILFLYLVLPRVLEHQNR